MKTKISGLIGIFLLLSISMMAQNKTEKVKVYGNCSMCENRIEKAAKSIQGVTVADWDKNTKMLKVTFDASKTDVHKVQKAIAKVGHDTQMYRAKNEVYQELSGCCKYERPKEKAKKEKHEYHDHDHEHDSHNH